MTPLAREQRYGIIAFLGTAAIMLAGLVLFSHYPAIFNRGREYHAVFHTVAGLNVGDEVRYGGLLVGSVTTLDLYEKDPTRIIVTFRVQRKTPVRTDTRASITQVGFLGAPYLNLTPGRSDAPVLAAGGEVPASDQMNFQDALSQLASFFERADTLLNVAERVARASPLDRIDRTLDQVERLVTNANASSERIFTQLDAATSELEGVMTRTDRLIARLDTASRTAGPQLASTQKEAIATLREMRTLASDLRDAINQGGGADEMIRNLASTADNLNRLTARIERDPTSILRPRELPKKTVGPKIRD
ncbi:MAG: MCE family protein [Gemmatimonadaceae bacterium]|nr:MCE family protein [Gemmatimonadaceae bacterium]NUQ92660.1 MCE family protein [Gemmatimonadaceae bacterium]NUR18124.1 MCE family protein [Gemmatimonadaceae bacterium]NUS98192.1 MCE family protein [Gemmatimonadaceae bacterium]